MTENQTEADNLLHLERLVPLCDSIRKGNEYAVALSEAASAVQLAESLPSRLDRVAPVVELLSQTEFLPRDEVARELAALAKIGHSLTKSVDAAKLREARFEIK